MAPLSTKYATWSCVPPSVAFDSAHNASFRTSKSPVESLSMITGNRLASIKVWICVALPAEMLETAQHASLRI